jgi:RNA polymerase sigma-70 factor (ECF subfamily)
MKAGFLELTETDLRAQMLWLQRLAVRLVRGERDADDAVQDTLVAALEHPPSLDRDVRPWLARVLANFTRSEHRADGRRRKRETEVARAQLPDAPAADELLARHEAARVVAGLVSGLREPHRTLVLLRFAQGLTPKEIAGSRGLPEGTVRRQLKEALDQLRAAMARHHEHDARDWRMALAPLLRAPAEQGALAGAWKGVMVMTVKTKTALGLGAAALVLVVILALVRGFSPWAGADPVGATPPVAGTTRTAGAPAAPAVAAAPTRSAAAPPPSFTAPATPADPARCEEKLAQLRGLASKRGLVSPAAFHRAQPSPKTEQKVAPIVERVLGRLPEKPAYQLECRASVCRVGAVADPTPVRASALAAHPRAGSGVRRAPRSQPERTLRVREDQGRPHRRARAATLDLLQRADGLGEEHPFETAAGASTCAERVAAVQKGLDEQRDTEQHRRKDDAERQRSFQTLPLNPELTRRIQAALRALPIGAPGAAADGWDCRGQGRLPLARVGRPDTRAGARTPQRGARQPGALRRRREGEGPEGRFRRRRRGRGQPAPGRRKDGEARPRGPGAQLPGRPRREGLRPSVPPNASIVGILRGAAMSLHSSERLLKKWILLTTMASGFLDARLLRR